MARDKDGYLKAVLDSGLKGRNLSAEERKRVLRNRVNDSLLNSVIKLGREYSNKNK